MGNSINIFALDNDPKKAAEYLCDKHVNKMLVESAQLLSTLARIKCPNHPDIDKLYKSTHAKHPCQLWLQEHNDNWAWLWAHVVYLNVEWKKRFHPSSFIIDHKSYIVASNAVIILQDYLNVTWLFANSHTPFVQCMPDKYRIPNDPVTAYRNYYIHEKSSFAQWKRGTPAPKWYVEGIAKFNQQLEKHN